MRRNAAARWSTPTLGVVMPEPHPVLNEFVQVCQQRFTCFFLASHHMHIGRMPYENARPENRIFIGPGEPGKVPVTAAMYQLELYEKMKRDGEFSDVLAKSLLVAIYSDWEEHFRTKFATSINARSNQVKCDLMGDLRRIRNCIVHERSILSAKDIKMVCLPWQLKPGPLTVTIDMFVKFIEQVNQLEVKVDL